MIRGRRDGSRQHNKNACNNVYIGYKVAKFKCMIINIRGVIGQVIPVKQHYDL